MTIILVIIMISFGNIFSQDSPDLNNVSYRSPTVAGSFYPDDPDTLRKWIEDYLSMGSKTDDEIEIHGLVVPHAGYVYSGWIAGLAYKQVQGRDYDAVIVISPSHTKAFEGACIFNGDAYQTPIGDAMIDKKLAYEITQNHNLINYGRNGHEWHHNRNEHALEVQIPFIQVTLPDTKIVPIVMGSQDNETTDALLKSVVKAASESNKEVLLVASSDLSHFHDANTAKRKDQSILKAFYRYDYFKMAMNFFSGSWEACGGGPVVAAMMIAEQLGANKAEPIKYANSSQSPYIKADEKRVVGYLSGIIYKDSEVSNLLPELNENQKSILIKTAKNRVNSIANNEEELYEFKLVPKELEEEYAVFVTLKKNDILRGCMGHTIATKSLMLAVDESAKLASSRDPRFPQVTENELEQIKLEITILSRMKRILDYQDIVPGSDGVLLRLSNHSALFLPQVATEQGWNTVELLENLCLKAGLSKKSYLDKNVEIFIFHGDKIEE